MRVGKSSSKANAGHRPLNMSTKKPASSDDGNRANKTDAKGGQTLRSKATVNRINMYRQKAPEKTSHKDPARYKPDRIAPDRRWFGNTRVVGQKDLSNFREELGKKINDTYSVVMKANTLPLGLLADQKKRERASILEVESFAETFSAGRRQKKPKLAMDDLEALVAKAQESGEGYDETKDSNIEKYVEFKDKRSEDIFSKGQSKRIWGELFKVIDSSDIIMQVLDARDPMGTRTKHIENFLRREKRHKQLVFILNKCDLVPTWVTRRWVQVLSTEYPTLAFHASLQNPFGKGALINLLRQFSKLHLDKKQISVGFIGYPNVGKSSVINAIRSKKVCEVAPVPGKTKVWRYITLMRRVFLIDCPGVVYPTGETETDIILKGVVHVERVENLEEHIPEVLERIKHEYIQRTYGIDSWDDAEDFLEQLARKSGKLLPGNQCDLNTVAKQVIHDWQRGRLPYYATPPEPKTKDEAQKAKKPAFMVPGALSNLDGDLQVDHEFDASEDEDAEAAGEELQKEVKEVEEEDEEVSWESLFAGGDDKAADDEDARDAAREVAKVKAALEEEGHTGDHEGKMRVREDSEEEEDGDISGLEDPDDNDLVDAEEEEEEEEEAPAPVPTSAKKKGKDKRRKSKDGIKGDGSIDDEFALIASQKVVKKERKKKPCSQRKKKRVCQ